LEQADLSAAEALRYGQADLAQAAIRKLRHGYAIGEPGGVKGL
jgi:hypothetical protein